MAFPMSKWGILHGLVRVVPFRLHSPASTTAASTAAPSPSSI